MAQPPLASPASRAPRHGRMESVVSGGAWLPPFGSQLQEMLSAPAAPVQPLGFVPIDWVQTTFPSIEPVKGGKLEGFIGQFRRTVKDLSKSREVSSDASSSHALVLHSLEGMVEAYVGLNESVKEMIKFQSLDMQDMPRGPQRGASAHLFTERDRREGSSSSLLHSNHGRYNGSGSAPSLPSDLMSSINGAAASPSPTTSTGGKETPYSPQTYVETPQHSPKHGGGGSALAPTNPPPADLNTSGSSLSSSAPSAASSAREQRMADLTQDLLCLTSMKKHCVRTLRALRNLHMLVSAVDTIGDILADQAFQAARLVFLAVTELFHTLAPYAKLPTLVQINDHVEVYKHLLRQAIFTAWRTHMGAASSGVPVSKADKLVSLSRLHHCCRLVDSLFSTMVRRELVRWWTTVQLQSYNQALARRAFGDVLQPAITSDLAKVPGGVTGMECLEKQFGWIWQELRESWDQEYAQVFPAGWFVDACLARKFFETLRAQVVRTLEAQERVVREENERRRAVAEAKKARAIMAEMQAMKSSGSSSNLSAMRKPTPQPLADDDGGDGSPQPNGGGLVHSDSYSSSLSQSDDKPLPFDFYRPLLRTIEFENQMRSRWMNAQSEASLVEEDLFAVLGEAPNPALAPGYVPPPNPAPWPFAFGGYISSAFHLYLPHMLLFERARFYAFLEGHEEEDSWEVESADVSTCHFNAATRLFVMIQKSMERYAKVMPGVQFLDLFKEYRTSISNYLELLSKHLPAGKQLADEEVQSICATLNTTDYVLDRCSSLANTVVHMLSGRDPDSAEELTEETESFLAVLREQVDLTAVEEQISHLNHRATHILAAHIVRKLEPSLSYFKKSDAAGAAAAVSDENKYVREIILSLRQQLGDKAKMSSFSYLAQCVAQDFLTLYYNTLRKCSFRIHEGAAQQMLLDLQSIKNFLVHGIPEMKVRAARGSIVSTGGGGVEGEPHTHADGSTSSAPEPTLPAGFKNFIKFVGVQCTPCENLLKTLTAPNPRLLATYKAIFPNADNKSVLEVLQLRGLTSGEQERLIKAYNATIKDPSQHIQIAKSSFFGSVSNLMKDAKSAMQ